MEKPLSRHPPTQSSTHGSGLSANVAPLPADSQVTDKQSMLAKSLRGALVHRSFPSLPLFHTTLSKKAYLCKEESSESLIKYMAAGELKRLS